MRQSFVCAPFMKRDGALELFSFKNKKTNDENSPNFLEKWRNHCQPQFCQGGKRPMRHFQGIFVKLFAYAVAKGRLREKIRYYLFQHASRVGKTIRDYSSLPLFFFFLFLFLAPWSTGTISVTHLTRVNQPIGCQRALVAVGTGAPGSPVPSFSFEPCSPVSFDLEEISLFLTHETFYTK